MPKPARDDALSALLDFDFSGSRTVEMASQRVCRLLRARIHSGELPPGKRLVRRTLAKEMDVSPIPIAEAFYQLEQEGLVENLPMVGARVRPLTIDRVRNDLILREALDSQIARVLAQVLKRDQLDVLYAEAESIDKVISRPGRRDRKGMVEHARFHFHLAQLTGYAILVEENRRVWSRFFMQYAWAATELRPVPPDWHRILLDAIATGDPLVADAAARFHVRRPPEEHAKYMTDIARALERMAQQPEDEKDEA